MTKEFIPYEQAVALKELGFDEPCLAFFTWKIELKPIKQIEDDFNSLKNSEVNTTYCSAVAPTFSQAFRWFREKYGYYYEIFVDDDKTFGFLISYFLEIGRANKPIQRKYATYEEAELECLIKLIEIVKNK